MQVKTFTGASTKDIMARIKDELGPDAIILGTQRTSRKGKACYEIMAALEAPRDQAEGIEPRMSPFRDETDGLREEWMKLRKQLMAVLRPRVDLGLLTPRQQLVMEYLEREGVKEDVLLELWDKFRRSPDTPALAVMNEMVELCPWLGTRWSQKVHLLAGPSGCGKTSTALRLALASKKSRPETRILVVNADRSQGKGRLYLRHYTELSGLSYRELDNSAQWESLRADVESHDLVLIDLPGLPGRKNLDQWLCEMSGDRVPSCHVHMVLSPLFSPTQMDNYVSRMQSDRTASIIWTKLDEACNYGEILNQAKATGLPVSLFSVGPDLKNSLAQPRNNDVWRLLLRHELPNTSQ